VARYMIGWEIDRARIPTSAKERGTAWLVLVEMIKADIKKGLMKDWGEFPGEGKGYVIAEGTEIEIMNTTMQYVPYAKFEIHPVATLSQVEQAIKATLK